MKYDESTHNHNQDTERCSQFEFQQSVIHFPLERLYQIMLLPAAFGSSLSILDAVGVIFVSFMEKMVLSI